MHPFPAEQLNDARTNTEFCRVSNNNVIIAFSTCKKRIRTRLHELICTRCDISEACHSEKYDSITIEF